MDEPNFLKPKKPQECINHAMWDTQLKYAFWGLLVVGFFTAVFLNNIVATLIFITISGALFLLACVLDARHAVWHIKRDEHINKK